MRSSDISQHVSSLVLALEAWWALLRAAVVIRMPFGRQMVLRRAMNTGAMTRSVPCFRGLRFHPVPEGSQLFFHAWVPGPRILDLAAKEDLFGAFAPVSYQSIVPS